MITVIELLLGVILLVGLLTQIILPVLYGRQVFPIFSKVAKLESNLAEAKQHNYEIELEQQVEAETQKPTKK